MKTVLITGGTRGLGLAICRRLLADDWRVLTTARTLSKELEALLAAHRDRLAFFPADLSRPGEALRLAEQAGVLDGIDGFVANAAVGTEGLLTLMTESAIRECVEVNLLSTLLLARQVAKGMLERGGSIVFVSSVAAKTGFSGLSIYSATKGALLAFSRALARELGSRGVRCNCVLPGFLETEMSASLLPAQRDRVRRRVALGRLGMPEDVAGTVAYLLSPDARYVTGAEWTVDGGLSG